MAMCFVLYVGTTIPLLLKKWEEDATSPSVESLTERSSPIKQHFTKPVVQYVGSTSGCGCDYPHAMFQSGGWPEIDYKPEPAEKDELGLQREEVYRKNCEALVYSLRSSGEYAVELYGVWDGDFSDPPEIIHNISLEDLLQADFCFKERGFYKVQLNPGNSGITASPEP
jgi:hypothetical protein